MDPQTDYYIDVVTTANENTARCGVCDKDLHAFIQVVIQDQTGQEMISKTMNPTYRAQVTNGTIPSVKVVCRSCVEKWRLSPVTTFYLPVMSSYSKSS